MVVWVVVVDLTACVVSEQNEVVKHSLVVLGHLVVNLVVFWLVSVVAFMMESILLLFCTSLHPIKRKQEQRKMHIIHLMCFITIPPVPVYHGRERMQWKFARTRTRYFV